MQYTISFVWYSLTGGQQRFTAEGKALLQPLLLQFLENLHRAENSIVHFDSESLALAAAKNPQFQKAYEKRREQLLAHPRAACFPPAVFLEHRKTKGCPDVEEITPDMRSYSDGAKEGRLIDFAKMEAAVSSELKRYNSLAEIAAAASPGFARNINVFFPRVSSLEAGGMKLGSLKWHLAVGGAAMPGGAKLQALCLEDCMFGEWKLTAEQLSYKYKTSYVALDFAEVPFVRIEYDQPEECEGTISHLAGRLKRAACNEFLVKMRWGGVRQDSYN